mmetsp:Transcript_55780/g.132962  ORF Transcript_55780/g.132962 Transcript_55780/m.132962 type:complete len:396 (-) Transcript_55780:147-1334(-)
MEIRLDAVSGGAPPEDTYVAVRIGDVQKQSRFESSRTYKFNNSQEQWSYGRIEVFKRVGYLTVNLDKDIRDVKVPCESPGFPENLSMKLAISGDQAGMLKDGKSKAKVAMDASQRYIDEYQIEDILAEAMREVLRHRPEDPNRFLSNHFLQRSDMGPIKPKTNGTVPAIPRQRPTSGGKLPPLEGAPMPPKMQGGAKPVPKPSPQSKVPDFRCCPAPYWANLHKSFPTGQPQASSKPQLTPQTEPRSGSKFEHMPSVGGMLSPLRRGQVSQATQQLAAFSKKPSVGTWLSAPSVPVTGDITALRLKMRDGLLEASEKGNLKETILGLPTGPPAFHAKPSVASWLAAKPKKMARPWYFESEVADKDKFIVDLQKVIGDREDEVKALRGQVEAMKTS